MTIRYRIITGPEQAYIKGNDVYANGELRTTNSRNISWHPDVSLSKCDKHRLLVMATDPTRKQSLVGILRFGINKRWGTLESRGTWVHRDFQRCGIATRMWKTAIRKFKVKRVRVLTVTDRGFTLIESLRGAFPKIAFNTDDGGDRKLRDMRKPRMDVLHKVVKGRK